MTRLSIVLLCNYLLPIASKVFLKIFMNVPGPALWKRLPFLGHSYLLGSNIEKNIFKMKEKYGSVFRLDIGTLPTVFLCDWDAISAADKANAIRDRPFDKYSGFTLMRKTDSNGTLYCQNCSV